MDVSSSSNERVSRFPKDSRSSLENSKSIDDMPESARMHSNIVINSKKQISAQGSVFYVKKSNEMANIQDGELVLKIFKQDNLKSYFQEKELLNKLA